MKKELSFTKKIISLALTVFMLLSTVTCFAALSGVPSEMGDVDKNGEIRAKDARIVLRVAAKLEKRTLERTVADPNNDGKINSKDARLILRNSAGLENFDYGFDKDGFSYNLQLLAKGKYAAVVDQIEDGKTSKVSFTTDGKNFDIAVDLSKVLTDDEDKEMIEALKGISFNFKSMRIVSGKLHMLVDWAGDKIAMTFESKDFQDMNDIVKDFDYIKTLIPKIVTNDIKKVEKVTKNGKNYYKYTQNTAGSSDLIYIYCDSMGEVKLIERVSKNAPDKVTDFLNISKISPMTDENMFKIVKTENEFGAEDTLIGGYRICPF